MNKHVFGRKLSRSRPAREALFASLMRSLIINGKIETTKAKAKAVQGNVEKFVTLAKKGGVSGRRRILAGLDNAQDALTSLYQKVVPVFGTKTSGYTRLTSLPNRKGDNAEMARLEWTEKVDYSSKSLAVSKADKKKEENFEKKTVKKAAKKLTTKD